MTRIMRPEVDVVVIGTGIGGSTAGALLAREGLRVAFLEKNERIGGACSFYREGGVHVDLGAHFFSRGNRGPIGEVQHRLGARRFIRFVRCDPLFRLKGPGIDIRGNLHLSSLPYLYASIFRQSRISQGEWLPLLGKNVLPLMMPKRINASMDRENLEEYFLCGTQNPSFMLLVSIFMGLYFVLPYWRASVGEAAWCTKKALEARDAGYPLGGAVAVPKAFLDAALVHGARIEMNTRAEEICLEKGRTAGVRTADGRFFSSRAVVSATSIQDSMRLAGEENFPPYYRDHVKEMKRSLSAVQAKILLDRPVVKAGVFVGMRDRRSSPGCAFTMEDVRRMWESVEQGRLPDMFSFYCPVPTNFDSDLAPDGMQLLTVTTAAPTCEGMPIHEQERWIDVLLETVFEVLPEARKHVVWIRRFGSGYLENWLGKRGGPVISTSQDPLQVGRLRIRNETPVKGLFLAGDCAGGRGIGTELACQSGIDCADALLRALNRRVL